MTQFRTLDKQEMLAVTGGDTNLVSYAVGYVAGALQGLGESVVTSIGSDGTNTTVGSMKTSGGWQS